MQKQFSFQMGAKKEIIVGGLSFIEFQTGIVKNKGVVHLVGTPW